MSRNRRRLGFGVILAVVGVGLVHLVVDRLTRDPPNYSSVEDGLWIGGDVREPPKGTRAVLNLCESEDAYVLEWRQFAPIRDGEPAPSLNWLGDRVEYIESARASGRITYVHCRNGVSRSAMVVAAYLMKRRKLSRDQALEFLRSRRPEIRPNPAFMKLLLEWEQRVKA